jgi:hypothetical protein
MNTPFEGSQFAIPATPAERTCVQSNTELFGAACGSCVLAAEGTCDILETAHLAQKYERERDDARRDLDQEKHARVEDNKDQVIPNFYTTNGIMARIRTEPDLAAEFVNGTAAVVFIDLRGLHAKNETLGESAGDFDLQQAGARLTSARSNAQPGTPGERDGLRIETTAQQAFRGVEVERRRHPSANRDIGYRGNHADELVVLVRSIDVTELGQVAERVADLFSTDRAIQDSTAGDLPLIASVAYAHVDEIDLDYTNPIDLFQAVHDLARTRHQGLKTIQYAEMWSKVRSTLRERGQQLLIKPSDPRLIAEHFITVCCPQFALNARAFYEGHGIPLKPPVPKRQPRSRRHDRSDT